MSTDIDNDKSPFITTYLSIGGWKAIHYWWNKDLDGFWEPWQTADFSHATEEPAIADAKAWSEAEGIRYIPRVPVPVTERITAAGTVWTINRLPTPAGGVTTVRIITGPHGNQAALLNLARALEPNGGSVSFLIANQPLH